MKTVNPALPRAPAPPPGERAPGARASAFAGSSRDAPPLRPALRGAGAGASESRTPYAVRALRPCLWALRAAALFCGRACEILLSLRFWLSGFGKKTSREIK